MVSSEQGAGTTRFREQRRERVRASELVEVRSGPECRGTRCQAPLSVTGGDRTGAPWCRPAEAAIGAFSKHQPGVKHD